MQYCLGMLSNVVKVWEAQCPAVVPLPHIQNSVGMHFTKENTQWGSKWDKEVFKRKGWGEYRCNAKGASLREWDVPLKNGESKSNVLASLFAEWG